MTIRDRKRVMVIRLGRASQLPILLFLLGRDKKLSWNYFAGFLQF